MKTLLDLIQPIPADRTAIILPESNIRVSYGAFRDQVDAVAEALAAAGIGRGDRVGIALPNGLPMVVSFFAAAMAGTAAPLNPGYKEDEFRFFLEDTDARVLILPPDGLDEARRAAGDTVPILTIDMDANGTVGLSSDRPAARRTRRPRRTTSRWCCTPAAAPGGRSGCRSPMPTSAISADNVARSYELGPDDVALCVMPLFHVHGLVASTLGTLSTGGTWWFPPSSTRCRSGAIARDHGVTWYSAVPTIHQLLLARADPAAGKPAGAERLRFIRSCSAALPPPVMHDLEQAFGAPVLEAYGMTEAAHQMASNPLPPAARKPGSVGRGTDVQISIMDADGTHLPAGERGEVVIKGPNVTRGYENNPEANAKSFTDGWFRTGDQGFLDADGYLTLVGAAQGADQPRRREDLAARDRRGAAARIRRSPKRCASACRTRPGAKRWRRRSC